MSQTPPGERTSDQHNIAAAITEVSERATLLVREEIELAKAEVTEKAGKLVKGAVVGVAAGVFVLMAVVFALIGCAWLLYYYLPVGDFAYFWGFFAMAVILLLLGALAGFIAAKVVKRGSPPTPRMAIQEARKIREAVSAGPEPSVPAVGAPVAGAPVAGAPVGGAPVGGAPIARAPVTDASVADAPVGAASVAGGEGAG